MTLVERRRMILKWALKKGKKKTLMRKCRRRRKKELKFIYMFWLGLYIYINIYWLMERFGQPARCPRCWLIIKGVFGSMKEKTILQKMFSQKKKKGFSIYVLAYMVKWSEDIIIKIFIYNLKILLIGWKQDMGWWTVVESYTN